MPLLSRTLLVLAITAIGPTLGIANPSFQLRSTAFAPNGSIPKPYTCQGNDTSPPLSWEGLPEGTRSLALVVTDPDAPDPAAPTRTWVHWVVYNLPPNTPGLIEGRTPSNLPKSARNGTNDWKRTGYGGPCPPIGRHRYIHTLYALDTVLADLNAPTRDALSKVMQPHILGEATLIGTYEKSR